MSVEEIKKAKIEGYKKALQDVISGKNPSGIYADLSLGNENIEKVGIDWAKVLPLWTGIILTLSAVFFGYTQYQQKNQELELTKVKSLSDLVDKLSSKDQSHRKYATFAAISLGVKGFDNYVISSITPEDADSFDIEALKLMLNKASDYETQLKIKFFLSKSYSKLAEQYKDSNSNLSSSFAKEAISFYVVNAQARYRIGRIKQDNGAFEEALNDFNLALKDSENKLNAFAELSLKISIYERIGECLQSLGRFEEAQSNYEEAVKILEPYPNKDENDKSRLQKDTQCVEKMKAKEKCI